MSNQSDSPNGTASLGTAMPGPVDLMWKHFVQFNNLTDAGPEQKDYMEYIFFCASMQIYNVLMESLHKDHSMKMMSQLSEALRINIDKYFQDRRPQPIEH